MKPKRGRPMSAQNAFLALLLHRAERDITRGMIEYITVDDVAKRAIRSQEFEPTLEAMLLDPKIAAREVNGIKRMVMKHLQKRSGPFQRKWVGIPVPGTKVRQFKPYRLCTPRQIEAIADLYDASSKSDRLMAIALRADAAKKRALELAIAA